MKFDIARNWHRKLGHLNYADVVRIALATVGELGYVFIVCALGKIAETTLVPRMAESQAEKMLERVSRT